MANSGDCTLALPEVQGVMHRPAGLPPLPFEPVLHSKALRMLARYSRDRGEQAQAPPGLWGPEQDDHP